MNERELAQLEQIRSSKKYRDICPDTVERVFVSELSKRRNIRKADKAARSLLHQITGAFMTPEQLKAARDCLEAGDITGALMLHSSTRERIDSADALFRRAFEVTGAPALILDLACGLNPIYLGSRGFSVRGYDISGGIVALINSWAESENCDVRAELADLIARREFERADVALMMKLLPVLETQRKGAAMELMISVPAPRQLVSFPTRTLSGRGVGMEAQYTRWFESTVNDTHIILDRFVTGCELCYITEAKHG